MGQENLQMQLRNQQGLGHTRPCNTQVESVIYPKSYGEPRKVVCKQCGLDVCFRNITRDVENEWRRQDWSLGGEHNNAHKRRWWHGYGHGDGAGVSRWLHLDMVMYARRGCSDKQSGVMAWLTDHWGFCSPEGTQGRTNLGEKIRVSLKCFQSIWRHPESRRGLGRYSILGSNHTWLVIKTMEVKNQGAIWRETLSGSEAHETDLMRWTEKKRSPKGTEKEGPNGKQTDQGNQVTKSREKSTSGRSWKSQGKYLKKVNDIKWYLKIK